MPQTLLAYPRGSDTVHFKDGLGVYIEVILKSFYASGMHLKWEQSRPMPKVDVAYTRDTFRTSKDGGLRNHVYAIFGTLGHKFTIFPVVPVASFL